MITLGADPEFFLRSTLTGGVVPACGLIGGTKGAPEPLDGLPEGFAVQEDNVMVEYNIPPCDSANRFERAVRRGLVAVMDLVRTRYKDQYDMDFHSHRVFSAAQLDTEQAQVFGCSQDFNGYAGGKPFRAVKPESLQTEDGGAWRFAGGHVHLGYQSEVPANVVAQFADLFLALPSVALDKQGARRRRYGTPGRYRPTAYGIEYRTLSNFWIFDESLRYQIGERAYNLCATITDAEFVHALYQEIPWTDVKAAVIREQAELAADLLAYLRTDLEINV